MTDILDKESGAINLAELSKFKGGEMRQLVKDLLLALGLWLLSRKGCKFYVKEVRNEI